VATGKGQSRKWKEKDAAYLSHKVGNGAKLAEAAKKGRKQTFGTTRNDIPEQKLFYNVGVLGVRGGVNKKS